MKLMFSPVRMDTPLDVCVEGEVLILNGEALDFGPLPAGAVLPRGAVASTWIAGDVTRDTGGQLCVPLILPHGGNPPHATLFPEDMTITGDGVVALPAFDSVGVMTAMDEEEDQNDD